MTRHVKAETAEIKCMLLPAALLTSIMQALDVLVYIAWCNTDRLLPWLRLTRAELS